MKTEIVRARIEPDIKAKSEAVLAEIGMSQSDAIRLFLTQIAIREEFPIELKSPGRVAEERAAKGKTTEGKSDKDQDGEAVEQLFDQVLNKS